MPIIENIEAVMVIQMPDLLHYAYIRHGERSVNCIFLLSTGWTSRGSVKHCEVSEDGKDPHNSIVFSLKNQVGGLARALQVFQVTFMCFFPNLRRIIPLLAEVSLYLQVHLLNYKYVFESEFVFNLYTKIVAAILP